ncbi:lysyl oxidase family protein [Actinoplanes sp. TFC3]|uniref:lysyl oxidase family protein n=1 Tax=Actinoplanes sp. TFC3 TaxID=1710355 RepID=UPI000830CC3B|nr:lysyl oxidase family protein [Actinoplanes sp. TFC3]
MAKRSKALGTGAVATALVLTGVGIGAADAATDPPPLAFTLATPNVTAERVTYDGQAYLYLDLGVHVIAGKDPFEIRATRKSYADPIVAQQQVIKNGKKKSVTLPAGMVTGWGGLKDFTTVTFQNEAGAEVKSFQTDFCPNSYDSVRTRRDAPAETPYPRGCSDYNPFNLGAVWGIQAGWNATTDSMPRTGDFDLAAGKYTATVTLNQKYRDYFQIAGKDATETVNLTIVDVEEGKQGAGVAEARIKAARVGADTTPEAAVAEHGDHGGQGDANLQVSAYKPGFRPPAKAPKAVKASSIARGPRPDLRSLPAWGISLSQDGEKSYVNFGATVWNAGTSPLLVDGFRRTGTELMDAYQYFFDANGKEVGSVEAGTMEWDPREGHRHWHFTDFAQYNLLSADKKLAVRSGKEAFCLANTDQVDYTVKNAKWRPDNTDLSTSCGQNTAVAVREVLDIGNGDTYTQERPGQSFEVTDLPNGTYYIEVKANPSNKLTELSTTNNTALREIHLGGTPTERTLEVPSVNGLD